MEEKYIVLKVDGKIIINKDFKIDENGILIPQIKDDALVKPPYSLTYTYGPGRIGGPRITFLVENKFVSNFYHDILWQSFNGEIPEGKFVACENELCVNGFSCTTKPKLKCLSLEDI